MKCLLCESISWQMICQRCTEQFLTPQVKVRELIKGFKCYSFYNYEDIKTLIYTKYSAIGSNIFTALATPLQQFAKHFISDHTIYAIGIDDNPYKGYAHSAILAKALQSTYIKPLYGRLRANSKRKFARQSYAFRLTHVRQFIYNPPHFKHIQEVILVDDIVTTGLTLLEAREVLLRAGISVDFALVLCDLQGDIDREHS